MSQIIEQYKNDYRPKNKRFRNDLYSSALDHEQIFQNILLMLIRFISTSFIRSRISNSKISCKLFRVHLNEVLIVGSSKLGYSLSPLKLYNKFDSKFLTTNLKKDKSDIDIAVVSNELFLELKEFYTILQMVLN